MTDREIREGWEWCGVRPEKDFSELPGYVLRYPKLDLNNLFKYAVPKLERTREITVSLHRCHGSVWGCLIETHFGEVSHGTGKTPAIALFKAIQQVIDGGA